MLGFESHHNLCSWTTMQCAQSLITWQTLKPPWRNWLARSAVNRKAGGSSPPGGVYSLFGPNTFLLLQIKQSWTCICRHFICCTTGPYYWIGSYVYIMEWLSCALDTCKVTCLNPAWNKYWLSLLFFTISTEGLIVDIRVWSDNQITCLARWSRGMILA